MLVWVVVFLAIALVAGVFGFTGISVAAQDIAKVIFYIFVILFIGSLLFHMLA